MRKSILIIGTLVLALFNLNATNTKTTPAIPLEIANITKTHIAQVFDWEVKTNKGLYTGTTLSLEKANQMICLVSRGEIITAKTITSYLMLKKEASDAKNRNYFWEVKTITGFAKGWASTEAYAQKMITLVSSGDAIVSKIIISQPQQ